MTQWKKARRLDTLAAAYAEVGDFASAIKWETEAIELASDTIERDELRSRLKLFEDKKAYRASSF